MTAKEILKQRNADLDAAYDRAQEALSLLPEWHIEAQFWGDNALHKLADPDPDVGMEWLITVHGANARDALDVFTMLHDIKPNDYRVLRAVPVSE